MDVRNIERVQFEKVEPVKQKQENQTNDGSARSIHRDGGKGKSDSDSNDNSQAQASSDHEIEMLDSDVVEKDSDEEHFLDVKV